MLLILLCKFYFIKKEALAQLFTCEICEISKNTFFTEHLRTTASELHTVHFKGCVRYICAI